MNQAPLPYRSGAFFFVTQCWSSVGEGSEGGELKGEDVRAVGAG